MKQLRESSSASYENVKSEIQLTSTLPQNSPCSYKQDCLSIQNKKDLQASLQQSYQFFAKQQGRKLARVGKFVNRVSFFLQTLWRELMPVCIKGNSPVQLQETDADFYELLRTKGHLIGEGGLVYCLDICRRAKNNFIIAVYDRQERLAELPVHVYQRMKNYLVIPIKNSSRKQLQLLSLSPKPTQKLVFYLCRFNFAGQVVVFCEIDQQAIEEDLEIGISLGEFSVNDYLEFEESTVNRLKNEKQS